MRLILLLVLLTLFINVTEKFSQSNILREDQSIRKENLSIGQSYRIYPSNVTQTESMIVRHPSNPNYLFASANTINFITGLFISEGVYVTSDQGNSWYGSDTCTGFLISTHYGDPGIAIDKDGRFIMIRKGQISNGTSLFSHYSNDAGLSWSNQKTIAIEYVFERAALISDNFPAGSHYGRTYAAWVSLDIIPYPVKFSFTDDGAETWSVPAVINSPAQRTRGADISLGTNGIVYVCWAVVTGVSPFTEDYIGFAKSTNGGADWTVIENAYDMNGISGLMASKENIRVDGLPRIDTDNSGGIRNGWIYIVTTEKDLFPAGTDPDIILHRSIDGGSTWSGGIRVNQDAINNGKIQYFPELYVDDEGGVNIIYYDDRHTTSDSAGLFLSRSIDGGNTWNDFEISDHNFKPVPIGGLGQGYQGDNIGLTSTQNTLWPVWMDNSTGIYQIWTCPIEINTLEVEDEDNSIPAGFVLKQNFPNPFNPETTIAYELKGSMFITLRIYDANGREVKTLVEDYKTAGRYKAVFNTKELNLSSGIYYYRLSSLKYSQTKAMILLK